MRARWFSRDAALLALVGHAAGTLPRALRMAAEDRVDTLRLGRHSPRTFVHRHDATHCAAIALFTLYFVMPKVESTLKDFNVALPAVAIWVIVGAHHLFRYNLILVWVPLVEARPTVLVAALPSGLGP